MKLHTDSCPTSDSVEPSSRLPTVHGPFPTLPGRVLLWSKVGSISCLVDGESRVSRQSTSLRSHFT